MRLYLVQSKSLWTACPKPFDSSSVPWEFYLIELISFTLTLLNSFDLVSTFPFTMPFSATPPGKQGRNSILILILQVGVSGLPKVALESGRLKVTQGYCL